MNFLKRKWWIPLSIILGIVPVWWIVFGLILNVNHVIWAWFVNSIWKSALFPNGWNLILATPFFAIVVVGVLAAFLYVRFRHDSIGNTRVWPRNTAIAAALLLLAYAVVSGVVWSDWNARFYNESSTYVVTDTSSLPNSLERIGSTSGAQVTITQGEMPSSWEPRVASLTGATYVMKKTGDSNMNTELMIDTVSYIYDGSSGSWTGIRNGINRQPIFGVTSWSGTGESVRTCEFKGDYRLNKAFHGSFGMNLNDSIAKFDPWFRFYQSDAYGYCKGNQPIIVIPGTKLVGNYVQVATEAYGVMTITGSSSGEPVIKFTSTVKPGDFPGPVYPTSLTSEQRKALEWSAGWVMWWQPQVGFAEADSPSQEGNTADFLLKSKVDGRLYWVTPMKPRNTDSQTIVAYSIIAADEVTGGKLNAQRIYVLNDGDTNIVNFNDLENAVTQAVAKADPGFFTGATDNVGRIAEFIPIGAGEWMVFAERGGRAVYMIKVSGGSKLHTQVFNLNSTITTEETPSNTPSGSGGCNSPSELSDRQIIECVEVLLNELKNR